MTDPRDPAGYDGDQHQPCRAYLNPHHPGVRLVGELDVATRDVLVAALHVLGDEQCDVRVDIGELDFIDVASVYELVRFTRQHHPHRVLIESPSPLFLRIVDLLFADTDLHLT